LTWESLKDAAKPLAILIINLLVIKILLSQVLRNADSLYKTGQPSTGRLWGYAFGDLYDKPQTNTLARGGSKQHTGIPQGRTKIQMRWIYLGYDFNISRKFSTAILLAAEDYITTGTGTTNGELLADIKLAFYIKLINLRWKNIWKATDLVLGQVGTPAYSIFTEQIWGYRPIDWRVTDIRRTPSYDSGITVQGKYGKDVRFGYDVREENGTSERPENDNFKWYYADV